MSVVSTLSILLERLVIALRSLAVVVAIFGSVYLFGRLIAVPAVARLLRDTAVDETVRHTVVKVTGAVFLILGVYLALPLSGLVTTPTTIAALTAGATIAIGFAAREILSNFVSGAILVLDPEFHVGDWIEWDGREGIVEDIGFRVTRIHTFDNELVTVPNADLTTNAVTNPVSKDRRRITCDFGIGYGDDIDRAFGILIEEALSSEDIQDRPAPKARLIELADSSVGLRSFFWITDPARTEVLRIRSEYVKAVKERFDDEGIEMPYPYRELVGSVGTYESPVAGIE